MRGVLGDVRNLWRAVGLRSCRERVMPRYERISDTADLAVAVRSPRFRASTLSVINLSEGGVPIAGCDHVAIGGPPAVAL